MFEKELEKAFGLDFKVSDKLQKTGLPRYMASGREIYMAESDGFVFYIIKISKAVDSRVLSKEMALYEENFHAPVAFLFNELTKNNRNAYIKHHIPFILVPTQIYLPFLGMLFSKKLSASERKESLPLSANAQKILFYLIYNKKEQYSKQHLATTLDIDPVYVTRGTKELVSRALITEVKNGRNIVVERKYDSKELFDMCSTALINPIDKVIFVKKTNLVSCLPKSFDYALSEISMLNPPSVESYACYKKDKKVELFEIVDEPEWEDSDKICRVELWKYNPSQLSKNALVDELSLYCSLKDTKDSRVEGELEKMLEDFKWQ